jgi:uncharacterized membrane protein YvlD (DUF360 family)
MKNLLKILVYSFISVYVVQIIFGSFVFGGNSNMSLLLVLISLTVLNVFIPPILSILSLPYKGPGGLFLTFVLNLVVFYMLTILLPSFYIRATSVAELNIFGFVLPSKSLTKSWSLVFSALLYVVVLHFLKWLGVSKKK